MFLKKREDQDTTAKANNSLLEEEEDRRPTSVSLMIRVVAGAYLVRLAFNLIRGLQETTGREKIFIGIFIVVFAIGGLVFVISALRAYMKGEYVQGNGWNFGKKEETVTKPSDDGVLLVKKDEPSAADSGEGGDTEATAAADTSDVKEQIDSEKEEDGI